jgi:hypothetical protein
VGHGTPVSDQVSDNGTEQSGISAPGPGRLATGLDHQATPFRGAPGRRGRRFKSCHPYWTENLRDTSQFSRAVGAAGEHDMCRTQFKYKGVTDWMSFINEPYICGDPIHNARYGSRWSGGATSWGPRVRDIRHVGHLEVVFARRGCCTSQPAVPLDRCQPYCSGAECASRKCCSAWPVPSRARQLPLGLRSPAVDQARR